MAVTTCCTYKNAQGEATLPAADARIEMSARRQIPVYIGRLPADAGWIETLFWQKRAGGSGSNRNRPDSERKMVMIMKRHSSAVFLMELTLVILFFSLSAVVTLRLFVTARQQEQQSALRSDAMELAEDTAELVYAKGVPFLEKDAGWTASDVPAGAEAAHYCYKYDDSGLLMEIFSQSEQTVGGVLDTSEVRITGSEKSGSPGQILCRLPVKRYYPQEAGA